MVGEKLHELDVALSDYVLSQIHVYYHQKNRRRFRQFARKKINPAILAQALDRWPEPMAPLDDSADVAWENRARPLLLATDELHELEAAFGNAEPVNNPPWWPWPAVHKSWVHCVPEIRAHLTKQNADGWGEASGNFVQKLEDSHLMVSLGIEIVREWMDEIRRLLQLIRAIGFLPFPQGPFPTPTHPTPQSFEESQLGSAQVTKEEKAIREAMDELRRAIAQHLDGKNAKVDDLIRAAKLNRSVARKALRRLGMSAR